MYYSYILECSDNSLYTGITTDLERRVRQHNGEIVWWAKYTRVRQPVKLVYSEEFETRSEACKRESEIKKMKKIDKLKLIEK